VLRNALDVEMALFSHGKHAMTMESNVMMNVQDAKMDTLFQMNYAENAVMGRKTTNRTTRRNAMTETL